MSSSERFGAEHPTSVRRGYVLSCLVLAVFATATASARSEPEATDVTRLDARVVELLQEGRPAEALPLAERSLEIRQGRLGARHPDTAKSLNNLGVIHRSLGHYHAAERFYREALSIRRDAFGLQHPETVQSLNNLAAIHQYQGNHLLAEALYRQALQIKEEIFGPEHESVARTLNNIAILRRSLGDNVQAEGLQRRALAIREKVLGIEHPETAASLTNLGVLHRELGNYARADALLGRSLRVHERILRPGHPQLTGVLSHLAILRRLQGDFETASRLLARAEEIAQGAYGQDHPVTADVLVNQALVHQSTGSHAEAERLLRQALVIQRRLGPDHPNVALTLNNLGALYRDRGDYAAAERVLGEALAIDERVLGSEHPATAATLSNLGVVYLDQQRYREAEPLLERTWTIHQTLLGTRHPRTAAALLVLAGLHRSRGNLTEAQQLGVRVLASYEDVLGARSLETAHALVSLSATSSALGDYIRAERLLRRALGIYEDALGTGHPDTASALLDLAGIHQAQGDHRQAERALGRALEIYEEALGPTHVTTAKALNQMASVYAASQRYEAAEPLVRRALAIDEAAFGTGNLGTSVSLSNLAAVVRAQGDATAAEALYRRILQMRRAHLGDAHPATARALSNVGMLVGQRRGYEEAEALLRAALATHGERTRAEHPEAARILKNLGLLHAAQGDFQRGAALLHQALQASSRATELAAAVQSERQALALRSFRRSFLDSWLSVARLASVSGDQLWEEALAWKSAVTLRQARLGGLRASDPRLSAAERQEVARIRQELDQVSREIAQRAYGAEGRALPGVHANSELERLTTRREALERELASLGLGLANADRRSGLLLRDALPDRAALIDLLEYEHHGAGDGVALASERRLLALVVRPGRPVHAVELGAAQPIADAVQRWRETYGDGTNGERAATRIRDLVWAPLESLVGDARLLMVSPDGALARFPFAALTVADPQHYLLEDHTIVTIPAPQLLSELRARSFPAKPQLVAVGAVDFDVATARGVHPIDDVALPAAAPPSDASWAALPATGPEIEAVAAQFRRRVRNAPALLLRGQLATEAAVRREAPGATILHLATHGFFAKSEARSALSSPRSGASLAIDAPADLAGWHPGLLSGIVLAGANAPPGTAPDDGLLTALEVGELDLAGVELVVLSACDTGLGETAGGEGLLSLQRSFGTAGAGSVVASLWKVDDRATSALMARFYENLWARALPRAEALRDAQLWMLREGAGELFGSATSLPPYYWASFVLSGAWGALTADPASPDGSPRGVHEKDWAERRAELRDDHRDRSPSR
jgi:CHAT domain-containing protein